MYIRTTKELVHIGVGGESKSDIHGVVISGGICIRQTEVVSALYVGGSL